MTRAEKWRLAAIVVLAMSIDWLGDLIATVLS